MARSDAAGAPDPTSDAEQVTEEETNVVEEENAADEEDEEEEEEEEDERTTVANAASARKALFATVEGGSDGTDDVLSCRPIVKLFFLKSKDDAPVVGDEDMTAREQQKLLLDAVRSHKFNKGYARRLFAGLTTILRAVVENEDYVPASAYDDDDDGTATRTLNASTMQQPGSGEQAAAAEIVPDEESSEALLFMRACSLLVESYLDGLVERRPDDVPAGKEFPIIDEAFTVAELLHDSLFSLQSCGPVAVRVQATVSSLCEQWWHESFEGREQLVTMLVPLLVAKTLDSGPAQKSDVRRLFLIRDALDLLDFDDPSIDYLRSLLLRTASSPLYTKSVDGRRLISYLFQLDPNLVTDLHRAIRVQIPDARKTTLDAYGDVYLRAWKDSADDPAIRSSIEENALQDLMFASLHVADRSMAKSIRTVLSPLHESKKSPDVDKLLHKMYGPILWRALSAANALVRLNAASALADTFPLRDPDESEDRTEACVDRTVAALTSLLQDPEPKVRVAGSDATGRILVTFWDALPSGDIRTLLNEIITKHASDASSSAVRAEAIFTVSHLLDAEHSRAVLRQLLPSLGNLIHDRVEKVRLAVVKMLQKIKKIRGLKYYHVVPVDHLLARLQAEGEIMGNPTGPVASALTALMLNSYFPQGENITGSDQIKRTLSFLTNNPEAAAVFYSNFASHLSVNSVAKLAAMLLKCLSAAIEADVRTEAAAAKRGKSSGTGKKRRRSDEADAVEDDDSNKTLSASDTTLMAAIAETICCLWESIASALHDPDNEECYDFLVGAFSGAVLTDALSHFECKSKFDHEDDKQQKECHCICAAILRCAGNLQPTAVEGLSSHISSIDIRETTSSHIALFCVWGMQEDVAKSLAKSIKSGFGEDATMDGEKSERNSSGTKRSNKRKAAKKSDEELPFPDMPSDVAVEILSTILRGSDPSCVAAREAILGSVTASSTIEEALEIATNFAEKMLTANSAPDASKVAVTLAACEEYGRLALHKEASKEDQAQFSPQARTLLSWISTTVVPTIISKNTVASSPLGDLNLSRISVGSGASPAPPFSPIPAEPMRRRSNRNKTPTRFSASFELSTDKSISFDLDIAASNAGIAIALVKSAVVVFSEWLLVSGSGVDEVSSAALRWAQVLESEEVRDELLPAFIRFAVCLAKRKNYGLLKALLDMEEGTIEEASLKKMRKLHQGCLA